MACAMGGLCVLRSTEKRWKAILTVYKERERSQVRWEGNEYYNWKNKIINETVEHEGTDVDDGPFADKKAKIRPEIIELKINYFYRTLIIKTYYSEFQTCSIFWALSSRAFWKGVMVACFSFCSSFNTFLSLCFSIAFCSSVFWFRTLTPL